MIHLLIERRWMEYRGNILKINTSIEKSEEVKLY